MFRVALVSEPGRKGGGWGAGGVPGGGGTISLEPLRAAPPPGRPPRKIVEASLQSAQTRVFFFSSPTRCSLQAENNTASQ